LQTGFGSGSGFLHLGTGLESDSKNMSPNTSGSHALITLWKCSQFVTLLVQVTSYVLAKAFLVLILVAQCTVFFMVEAFVASCAISSLYGW